MKTCKRNLRNPRDILVRGPSKDKQTCCKRNRSEHHGRKTGFRHRFATIRFISFNVKMVIRNVCSPSQKSTEKEGQEWKRAHNLIPPPFFLKSNRKGSQRAWEQSALHIAFRWRNRLTDRGYRIQKKRIMQLKSRLELPAFGTDVPRIYGPALGD